MGIYDQYEDVQLKIGDVCCHYYRIGDKVNINDGVYIAPDGAVVIKDGKLLMTTDNIQDKWGGIINVETRNPIFHVAKEILNEQLQTENERLREALKEIQKYESDNFRTGIGYDRKVADIVHEALKETKQ